MKVELPYSWHESSLDSKLNQIMEKLMQIESRLDDADQEKKRQADDRRERQEREFV